MQFNDQNKLYQARQKVFKSQKKQYRNAKQYRSLTEDQNQAEQMKHSIPVYSDAVEWGGILMSQGPNAPINDQTDIEKIFKDSFETVKEFTEEEKEAYHKAYMTAAENEDILLNTTQLLQKNHYAVEEHTVKTDDGYVLTLFRIPPKSAESGDMQTKRPVVFLMHGLLGSSDDWLLMGPGKSLAYILADLDYDVWMGNARGNKYSRRHVSKNPGQPDFWQFSNDEIALHDLPTMIDYALSTSKQEKMYYVGYSEGTTTFFALASTKPEYNGKIIMMYALSPLVFMSNTRSPVIKMIAPNSPFYERLHAALGHGEFKPEAELTRTIGGDMLAKKSGCNHVASNVEFAIAGMVDKSTAQMVPLIEKHLPAGASTRQIKQYGQAVASREFRRYDYGPVINEKVYGSEVPPKYELSEVQVPVTLYYSANDWLAHPTDVEQLVTKLPQVKEAYKLPQTNWSHLDFVFSKAAPLTVYQRLITSIQENQSEKQVL
ncbi:lipase 3-like isoform X2 [Choristoneura fumiferana]